MDRQTILRYIASEADRPMKMKELARALRIDDGSYGRFRRTVKDLIDSGELVYLKRNRIGVAEKLNVAVGIMSITRSGAGFLIREGITPDIIISQTGVGTAFDGDKVMVRLGGKIGDRDAGVVIRVLERATRNIVGVFRKGKALAHVVPDNPRIHRDLYIHPDNSLDARDGEKVVAQLLAWDDPYLNPEGKIVERLGFPGQPGVDMLTVMRAFNLPDEFPRQVLDEAEQAAARLAETDLSERIDLTRECIYTIDPADAKDHDDAVSVEKIPGGYRLGVHIADVSHFVIEGTSLDSEAYRRGNSVYLPGMVVPMLPHVLSSDICSLKPNRKRLAHSASIEFDSKGKMLRWTLFDAVIKSRAKLTYEEVQDYFKSGIRSEGIDKTSENLDIARELAQLLSARRFAEGSLDFDLPEAKIIMNEKGEVIELGHRVRLESHRLVEEFMLAANRAVALELFRAARPALYRVHDKPDMEKLEAFSLMMSRLGHKFPVSPNMKPIQFARFLEGIKDAPEADFINELMLRSMQKAVYQRENIGHFGLAFSHYAHFTSPIRRYPDLVIHRLLKKHRSGEFTAAYAKRIVPHIDHAGQHCSETERNAEAAERQAIRVKQVQYMANHLGEEYDGVISGVTTYGFFVRLGNLGAEGLVRLSAIDDDYYLYDEKNYRVIGRRQKRTFRLGDAIRVGILKVDQTRAEIDLYIPAPPKPAKQKPAIAEKGKKLSRRELRENKRKTKRR
ncbi:ribonuclease R [candidate division GN15 bacterium]|uniref:Ribonuclease R n=1 Tax=candidate division GN15 bacterium TaxID=2072418 RepID=A0A855X3R6_9BACT|nr:MAG: ribonuclease R [candidate division GN15 bacterium]